MVPHDPHNSLSQCVQTHGFSSLLRQVGQYRSTCAWRVRLVSGRVAPRGRLQSPQTMTDWLARGSAVREPSPMHVVSQVVTARASAGCESV